MVTKAHTLTIDTPARQEFFDVTKQFEEFVAGSGVRTASPSPTRSTPAAVCSCKKNPRTRPTTARSCILQDTLNVLAKIAPPTRHEGQYLHPGPIHIRNAGRAARRASGLGAQHRRPHHLVDPRPVGDRSGA